MKQLEIEDIKKNAHSKTSSAIICGRLKRMPCEICGTTNTHAHHEDYNEPLNVTWLCQSHHMLRHIEIRNGIPYHHREANTHPVKIIDLELASRFNDCYNSLGELKDAFKNRVIEEFECSGLLFDKKMTGKSYIRNPEKILIESIFKSYNIEL